VEKVLYRLILFTYNILRRNSPTRAQTASLLRSLDHTPLETHTTPGRSPQLVAETATWTTHNRHKRRTTMPSMAFEFCDPSNPAAADLSLRPHGHLDTYNSFSHVPTAPVGQCPLIFEVSGWHSDAPHSVGLLWTSDLTRRRDLYLTTHNARNRQTSMPPAGFKTTIPASERPQKHALDRAATGTVLHIKWVLITCSHTP